MLFANINEAEKYDYLAEKFKAAYRWLRETDLEALAPGNYPILGQAVYGVVMEYMTIPEAQGRYEAHEKYFDIQYVVSGTERFGICQNTGAKEEQRIEEKDLIFYERPENHGFIVLNPGDLAVVAPEDLHMPKCQVSQPCRVKKVVVKVACDPVD